ncbi:MAG: plastocyanin/azurin family copper-binding protein [Gemmatimonadales bacterium]
MRRFLALSSLAATIAAVTLLASCGGESTAPPANSNKAVDVFTVNVAFSPNSVEIDAGDTVRFNIVPAANGEGHDVTFDAAPGVPANIKVTLNGVIARVFTTRGDFQYNCFVHPGMSGEILVQ